MSHRTLPVLIEIRLRWSEKVRPEQRHGSHGGLWIPATPHSRDQLAHAVELGNRIHGEGTHWIEERQA